MPSPEAAASDTTIRRRPGGHLLSVPGLSAAAIATGVKPSGDLDLAVVDLGQQVTAAGVFTRNELCAAPVTVCRERLARDPRARSIVVNSGNANAMTGEQGLADARAMLERLESRLGGPALVLSTGVIGVPLPIDLVLDGIDRAAACVTRDAGEAVARAILTTDTCTKTAAVEVDLPPTENEPQRTVTVGGTAKGSGMIHPDMATMLAIIATDAPLGPALAHDILVTAVDRSFHAITVDGDTSTNDSVLLLGGSATMPEILPDTARAHALTHAVATVASDLALKIVRDGEGATRVARIEITSARSHAEARAVASSIACSSLVKTALAGGDPNWGRILSAAANTGIGLDADRLRLCLGGIDVFASGLPLPLDPPTRDALDTAFSASEVLIQLDLGLGTHTAVMHTTDLTKGYVEINSEYTT